MRFAKFALDFLHFSASSAKFAQVFALFWSIFLHIASTRLIEPCKIFVPICQPLLHFFSIPEQNNATLHFEKQTRSSKAYRNSLQTTKQKQLDASLQTFMPRSTVTTSSFHMSFKFSFMWSTSISFKRFITRRYLFVFSKITKSTR